MPTPRSIPRRRRPLLWAVRSIGVVWAGVWSVLSILTALGGGSGDVALAAGACLAVCVPVVIAWGHPRVGSMLLGALAAASFLLFRSGAMQVSLTLPAAALAIGFGLAGLRRGRAGPDATGGAG